MGWCTSANQCWEGELGNLEPEDLPLALWRALSPSEIRAYDTSALGLDRSSEGQDEEVVEDGAEHGSEDGAEGVRVVRKLSLKYFRSKLVEHFDILWSRNQVVWPRSRGSKKPTPFFDSVV